MEGIHGYKKGTIVGLPLGALGAFFLDTPEDAFLDVEADSLGMAEVG